MWKNRELLRSCQGDFLGAPGSLAAPRLQTSNVGAMWDGIIPTHSSPSSRDPVWLQAGGFFCRRTTIVVLKELPASEIKQNLEKNSLRELLVPSLGRIWIWLHKIPVPSVCSALPALLFLIFYLFISFLSWHSQCHLVTVLGSLRAQQRILDHPNRVGNSLLKLEVPLECWEHLAPGFLWFFPRVAGAVHTPCCSLFQK